MATWHGYIGIENLALNEADRDLLRAELRSLGPASDRQPARLCHWRVRLDNQAAIYEAAFDTTKISVSTFKVRLGTLFSVNPDQIVAVTTFPGSNRLTTFGYNSVDYLGVVIFGDIGSSWQASRQAVLTYLIAAAAAWET